MDKLVEDVFSSFLSSRGCEIRLDVFSTLLKMLPHAVTAFGNLFCSHIERMEWAWDCHIAYMALNELKTYFPSEHPIQTTPFISERLQRLISDKVDETHHDAFRIVEDSLKQLKRQKINMQELEAYLPYVIPYADWEKTNAMDTIVPLWQTEWTASEMTDIVRANVPAIRPHKSARLGFVRCPPVAK